MIQLLINAAVGAVVGTTVVTLVVYRDQIKAGFKKIITFKEGE